MASDQDEHRDKRFKTAENTGSGSTSSTTPSATRPNAQPGPSPIPYDPLNNSSHFDNIHPFAPQDDGTRRRADRSLNDDSVGDSASKGKEVALPIRDGARGVLPADANETIHEDTEMGDAVPPSAKHEDGEGDSGDDDQHHGGDVRNEKSASEGKGRALSTPEESSQEASLSAENSSDGDEQDEDVSYYRAEHLDYGDNDDDDEDSGEDYYDPAPGLRGRHMTFVQVLPAETVDPPVQEFVRREDGTWDVRPEDISRE